MGCHRGARRPGLRANRAASHARGLTLTRHAHDVRPRLRGDDQARGRLPRHRGRAAGRRETRGDHRRRDRRR